MKTHEADRNVVPAAQCASMPDVRREIDRIDRALVGLLAERLTYIERAGLIKPTRNTVRDVDRIRDVLDKVRAACVQHGFPYAIAEPVWRMLMEGCIAHEFTVFDARSEARATAAGSQRACPFSASDQVDAHVVPGHETTRPRREGGCLDVFHEVILVVGVVVEDRQPPRARHLHEAHAFLPG